MQHAACKMQHAMGMVHGFSTLSCAKVGAGVSPVPGQTLEGKRMRQPHPIPLRRDRRTRSLRDAQCADLRLHGPHLFQCVRHEPMGRTERGEAIRRG